MPTSPLPRRLRAGTALAAVLAAAVVTGCGSTEAPAGASAEPSSASSSSSSSSPSSAPSSTSSSSPSSSAGEAPTSSTLQAALVDFAVEMPETELSAGTYTIEATNEGGASHDLVVEGPDGADVAATEILAPGASGSVEVTLEPGEYVFYCSVGNHRSMGMEVEVTVT